MLKMITERIRGSLARLLAVHAPSSLIENAGRWRASLIYLKTMRHVPAYQQLVRNHLGYLPLFVWPKDFFQLPVTDKAGYLQTNDLETVCSAKTTSAYAIQRSSGFSGQPTYWLKTCAEARNSYSSFNLAWNEYLNPEDKTTLVIVGFSLGTWASGTDLLRLSTELALHGGRKITHVAPGENVEDTLEIMDHFSQRFQRIIIAGNPVYIKELIDRGDQIDWPSLEVIFLTGGEPTTEAWRQYLAQALGINLEENPARIINAYGSSDFGVTTAIETELSIRIRRLALQDRKLAQAIFGRENNLPNLFQYQPLNHHIEQFGENFLVTYWSLIPLVRYNIRDRGRVFSFRQMRKILTSCGYEITRISPHTRPFKIPFLFVDARDDGTVSIGGANVYPGNVETALLEHQELHSQIEHFLITVTEDSNCNSRLVVELFLRSYENRSPQNLREFKQRASQAILFTLLRDNPEYKVTWEHNHRISPEVKLTSADDTPTYSIKRKYIECQSTPGISK